MKIEILPQDLAQEILPGLVNQAEQIPCQVFYNGQPLVVLGPSLFMKLIAGHKPHILHGISVLEAAQNSEGPPLNSKNEENSSLSEFTDEEDLGVATHCLSGTQINEIGQKNDNPLVRSQPMANDEKTAAILPQPENIVPEHDDFIKEDNPYNTTVTFVDDESAVQDYDEFSEEQAVTELAFDNPAEHPLEYDKPAIETAQESADSEISESTNLESHDVQSFVAPSEFQDTNNVDEQYVDVEQPPQMQPLHLVDPRDIAFETLLAARTDLPKQVIHNNIAFTMEASLTYSQASQDEMGNFYTLAGTPCIRDGRGVIILPLWNATVEAPWGRDDVTGLPLSPANLRFALIKERQLINKG